MTREPLERAGLRHRVDAALVRFLAGQRELLSGISPGLVPPFDLAEQFVLSGGKRLRPAFCYWGYRAAGGVDGDEIVAGASCLELLQACALVHDDVMDASDTRRGRPSMHRLLAELHSEQGWRGDADSFGSGAALLVGDLCLIWSDQMLGGCGLPDAALRRGQPVYDEMRVELMSGQYLDLLEQASGGSGVDGAMRVARFKSAKYTVERPLHLGAALAGGEPALVESLSAYGLPIGVAFQLRDDLLGVFGDPGQTGKPAGDDLREGKRTVLVAMAVEAASHAQARCIDRWLGNPQLDATGVAELRAVLTDTGAAERLEKLIGSLTEQALAALRAAPICDEEAREVLEHLAVAATARHV